MLVLPALTVPAFGVFILAAVAQLLLPKVNGGWPLGALAAHDMDDNNVSGVVTVPGMDTAVPLGTTILSVGAGLPLIELVVDEPPPQPPRIKEQRSPAN